MFSMIFFVRLLVITMRDTRKDDTANVRHSPWGSSLNNNNNIHKAIKYLDNDPRDLFSGEDVSWTPSASHQDSKYEPPSKRRWRTSRNKIITLKICTPILQFILPVMRECVAWIIFRSKPSSWRWSPSSLFRMLFVHFGWNNKYTAETRSPEEATRKKKRDENLKVEERRRMIWVKQQQMKSLDSYFDHHDRWSRCEESSSQTCSRESIHCFSHRHHYQVFFQELLHLSSFFRSSSRLYQSHFLSQGM